MPRLAIESYDGPDMSWLGSTHGIRNARTEVLDISAFAAATYYPEGYIPSGTPVSRVGGVLVPYDPAEATTAGAGVLAGFVLTDQKVVGSADFAVPVLDHGRVRTAALPIAFTVPQAPEKLAATTIAFV